MFLITSASYVTEDLAAEVGLLPPALLPVGNRKLIELQVELIRKVSSTHQIILTLPSDLNISSATGKLLEKLNVATFKLPHSISLGESIATALHNVRRETKSLHLLHGDTLVSPSGDEKDMIYVGQSSDYYNWHKVNNSNEARVWSGYFVFANSDNFLSSLHNCRCDFVEAVENYFGPDSINKCKKSDFWLDFGHVNTYYRSRANFDTSRSFNNIYINDNKVEKSSLQTVKLEQEYLWLESIPRHLSIYVPKLLGFKREAERFTYYTEYLPALPLSELFVHCNHGLPFWKHIAKLFTELIDDFRDVPELEENKDLLLAREHLIVSKTYERLAILETQDLIDTHLPIRINDRDYPSLREMIDTAVRRVKGSMPLWGIMHGDLCFSNILYDSRLSRLKVIDPRGSRDVGRPYGDIAYDLAKFFQSACCHYDCLVSGHFEVTELVESLEVQSFSFKIQTSDSIDRVTNWMKVCYQYCYLGFQELSPLIALHFITLTPLHTESRLRQLAFILNAINLLRESDEANNCFPNGRKQQSF
jgi:hypothetical protein